jgi:hypothetical protein
MTTRRASVAIWIVAAIAVPGVWLWGLASTPLVMRQEIRSVLLFTQPAGEIAGAQTVGQGFVAPYAGLSRIEVLLHNYGRVNRGTLTLRLREMPNGPDLAISTLAADSVGEETWGRFEFTPRTDSGGRTLYFQLDAQATEPHEAVTALVRPAIAYGEGTAYRNGQPLEGDLTFRVYFSVDVFTRATVLLSQLAEDRPGFWGYPLLYIAVGLGYIVLIITLAHLSIRLPHD